MSLPDLLQECHAIANASGEYVSRPITRDALEVIGFEESNAAVFDAVALALERLSEPEPAGNFGDCRQVQINVICPT